MWILPIWNHSSLRILGGICQKWYPTNISDFLRIWKSCSRSCPHNFYMYSHLLWVMFFWSRLLNLWGTLLFTNDWVCYCMWSRILSIWSKLCLIVPWFCIPSESIILMHRLYFPMFNMWIIDSMLILCWWLFSWRYIVSTWMLFNLIVCKFDFRQLWNMLKSLYQVPSLNKSIR